MFLLQNDTVRVLWALHEADAQEEGRGLLPWHGKEWRGSKSLHLVNPPHNSPPQRHDIKHWDITLNNVSSVSFILFYYIILVTNSVQ